MYLSPTGENGKAVVKSGQSVAITINLNHWLEISSMNILWSKLTQSHHKD